MALKLAARCDVSGFQASNGYIESFKARHGLITRSVSGEAGLVDTNIILAFKSQFSDKLKMYHPSDVYNCDETGLFWRQSNKKTILTDKEDLESGKFSKERLTILFCINQEGEKLQPLVIGKFKTPRSLKNVNLTVMDLSYDFNKKAWINLSVFKNWLEKLNDQMKTKNRRILLLLDNAPVHPVDVEYRHVELYYFPPNVTSLV